MNTLKICISRIVSRFYKCLKACLHKSAHTAAKNRLFAEKVCLCLCTECSLEDTGSCSSDRKTICESFIKSFSCIILLYSYKARSSFSNLILASYSMSRSFRSDHCHIYVRRRNDLSEMNVKAVCKHQHITFFKIRLNIVFI